MLLTLLSAVWTAYSSQYQRLEQPTAVITNEFQLETHQMSMYHLKPYLYNSKNERLDCLPCARLCVDTPINTPSLASIHQLGAAGTCIMHTQQKD